MFFSVFLGFFCLYLRWHDSKDPTESLWALEGREVGTPGSRKSSGVNPEGLLHPIALLPVLWTGILSPFSRTDVASLLGLDLLHLWE